MTKEQSTKDKKEVKTQITNNRLESKSDQVDFKNAELEILKNYKENTYESLGIVRIYYPSMQDTHEIDECYTSEFNRLIMETSTPTLTQLEEKLIERGSWSEKKDEEISTLQDSTQTLYIDIAKISGKKNKNSNHSKSLNLFMFKSIIGSSNKGILEFIEALYLSRQMLDRATLLTKGLIIRSKILYNLFQEVLVLDFYYCCSLLLF